MGVEREYRESAADERPAGNSSAADVLASASSRPEIPSNPWIPLVKPFLSGNELEYIRQTILQGNIAGDGEFTARCCDILRRRLGIGEVLLVSSGSNALDLAAALCDIQPGDEVVLPSFTFVSTANAFLRLGAKLVFVDIRPDTLNLDERLVASAVTGRTKAIVPVHYGGVGCEMDELCRIAQQRNLLVIEDAAHGIDAFYKDRALGSIGQLAIFSFHDTKNHTAGQAGALCINDPGLIHRAEILRDKGTNRKDFFRGVVGKYEWVDLGVGHVLSEISAAYLCAQLECCDLIGERRRHIDGFYRTALQPLEDEGLIALGRAPAHCRSNSHICYFLTQDAETRTRLTGFMWERRIVAPFHYVPLHTSPMGRRLGFQPGQLPITEDLSARLIRLPFYHDLSAADLDRVVGSIYEFYGRKAPVR